VNEEKPPEEKPVTFEENLEKLRVSQRPRGKVPRWIGAAVIIALILGAVAFILITQHPEISEIDELRNEIQNLRAFQQNLTSTLQQQQLQIQELRSQIQNISLLQTEVANKKITEMQSKLEHLERELGKLKSDLKKINQTNFEAVNNYLKSAPPGWNAKEMAEELQERFWVETKIVEKDNVKYLFLKFKCNCCPTTEWWWVTWQGLKPSSECPVQP